MMVSWSLHCTKTEDQVLLTFDRLLLTFLREINFNQIQNGSNMLSGYVKQHYCNPKPETL